MVMLFSVCFILVPLGLSVIGILIFLELAFINFSVSILLALLLLHYAFDLLQFGWVVARWQHCALRLVYFIRVLCYGMLCVVACAVAIRVHEHTSRVHVAIGLAMLWHVVRSCVCSCKRPSHVIHHCRSSNSSGSRSNTNSVSGASSDWCAGSVVGSMN
jgi:hypothetical protein